MTEPMPDLEDLRQRYAPRVMGRDEANRAYQLGWSRAQADYLARERARARRGMTALMARQGQTGPVALDDAYDLLALALRTFNAADDEPAVTQRDEEGSLTVTVLGCPTQAEPRARAMCSERVCPFWHRRQGWIEAMGLAASDLRDASAPGPADACTSVVALFPAAESQLAR